MRLDVVVASRARVDPMPRLDCAGKVMVWLPLAIAKLKVALPDPKALVALMVRLEFPAAVGVPVIAPVVALSERPAGRVPLSKA